jgi:hypothetical protein
MVEEQSWEGYEARILDGGLFLDFLEGYLYEIPVRCLQVEA